MPYSNRSRLTYTPKDFAKLCMELAVGTSAGNSLAESFTAALKRKRPPGRQVLVECCDCRREVFRWLVR